MATCSICSSIWKNEVEHELAQGTPLRKIERMFDGITRSSLSRHLASHYSGQRIVFGAIRDTRISTYAITKLWTG